MWCIEEKKSLNENLNERQLLECALEKLSSCYSKRNLPYFFGDDCNLIEHIQPDVSHEISTQIDRIIKDLDSIMAKCDKNHILLKENRKEKTKKLSFFKAQFLKFSLRLLRSFPRTTTFFVRRIVRKYLIELKYPTQIVDDVLIRNINQELYSHFDKAFVAICNDILQTF